MSDVCEHGNQIGFCPRCPSESGAGANIEAALRAAQDENRMRADAMRRGLRNDLIEEVSGVLYCFEEGKLTDVGQAVMLYATNVVFRRKVDTIVARVTDVLHENGINV